MQPLIRSDDTGLLRYREQQVVERKKDAQADNTQRVRRCVSIAAGRSVLECRSMLSLLALLPHPERSANILEIERAWLMQESA
jgi:predicted DCC family thiol-disulfide oxidoreductase YuxK